MGGYLLMLFRSATSYFCTLKFEQHQARIRDFSRLKLLNGMTKNNQLWMACWFFCEKVSLQPSLNHSHWAMTDFRYEDEPGTVLLHYQNGAIFTMLYKLPRDGRLGAMGCFGKGFPIPGPQSDNKFRKEDPSDLILPSLSDVLLIYCKLSKW